MKKYINCFLLFFAMSQLMVSCYSDKGNYDYKDIASIEIDTLKTPLRVTCSQNSDLVIEPDILNYDEAGLTFKWTLKNTKFGEGEFQSVVIGEGKDLNYKITETPGEYNLNYEIFDAKTGTMRFLNYRLLILSFAQQGMMIIHGDETSCDVSILANDKLTPQWDREVLQHNVFSTINGKRIEGEARGVKYLESSHIVNLFTDKGGYRTGGNALEIMNPYADMFMITPTQINYEAYDLNGYNEFLSNGGEVYWCQQASPSIYKKFDVSLYGLDYKAAPYFGTKGLYRNFFGVIYDQLNRRFLAVRRGNLLTLTKDVAPEGGFNMRNVGKDMVYAEHGFENRWFCVMQDPEATDEVKTKHLYVCNLNINNDAAGEAVYTMDGAKEIDNAVYYAFGSRGNVMYYASKDKLFTFKYKENETPSERLFALASDYPSYEITMMEIYKNSYPDYAMLDAKLLFVAIYDKTTQEGKLLSFDINEATGAIDVSSKKEYSGFGKIIDINYKLK